jgi:anti-anti-sigma factor
MSLTIQSQEHQGVHLLYLQGRLDTETSPDFELASYDAFQAGSRHFIVDLSQISYLSSAGLRVLLALAKKIENQGSLKLSGVVGITKEVFEKSGFARMFAIYADVNTAFGAPANQVARPKDDLASAAAGILGVQRSTAASSSASSNGASQPGWFARILIALGIKK